jgi:hypothetical protein
MPAFRSVVSALVSFGGRSFSTNSRPALRAAASGGRPRPAASRLLSAPEPSHASKKANRSALMVSACVVGMPCGKPL